MSRKKNRKQDSDETGKLSFSLNQNTIKVDITDRDGITHECELRELPGNDRDAWMNFRQSRIRAVGKDSAEIKDWKGLQSNLVYRSLFKVSDDSQFPEKDIEKWPAGVLDGLFRAALDLSGLNETGEDEEGND
jgi:hypothetical protein